MVEGMLFIVGMSQRSPNQYHFGTRVMEEGGADTHKVGVRPGSVGEIHSVSQGEGLLDWGSQ